MSVLIRILSLIEAGLSHGSFIALALKVKLEHRGQR